ncbi:MAG TPA: hypothetical protein VLT90_03970 [Terriglobales bacterium]|nr:hypothetical protein [Terriglobales bacterium]
MEHIDPAAAKRFDVRSGRTCEFCKTFDPDFRNRKPMDQMVLANRQFTAGAHLTEDGYVRHRMVELSSLTSRRPLTAA